MLMQQTLDILQKMRLFGLIESYLSQTQTPEIGSLSFEERFSIMIDHEWTLRQNKTLAQNLKQSKLRLNDCLEDIDFLTPRGLPAIRRSALAHNDRAGNIVYNTRCISLILRIVHI